MWESQISMNTWEKSEKDAQFFKKIEKFLNGKIRAALLAAAMHICISSELVPLFRFYLAAPHRASIQWALESIGHLKHAH